MTDPGIEGRLAANETFREANERREGRYFVAFRHAEPDRVVATGARYLVVEQRDPDGEHGDG